MGLMKDIAYRDPRRSGSDRSWLAIKGLFFDRSKVLLAMDRKTHKVLNHFGGLTMRIARNSIKSCQGVSQPFQPPSSHVGYQNRRIKAAYKAARLPEPKLSRGIKEIYYHYDPAGQTVIIGPIKFNSSDLSGGHLEAGNLTVLELLEYGGTAFRNVKAIQDPQSGKVRWIRSRLLPAVACTYRPRPFMWPAFQKAEQKLPQMWGGPSDSTNVFN